MRVYSACWNSKFRSSAHSALFHSAFFLFSSKSLITIGGAFSREWENQAELHQMRLAHSESESHGISPTMEKFFVDKFLELRRKTARRKNLWSWIKHPRSCWNEQTVEEDVFQHLEPADVQAKMMSFILLPSLFHLLAFARFYIVTA